MREKRSSKLRSNSPEADSNTSSYQTCEKCNQPIRLQKATYKGKDYHGGCFSCEVCKRSFKNNTTDIKETKGGFYDLVCYENNKEMVRHPSKQIHAQSQYLKHQKKVCLNSTVKPPVNDVILVSLLLTFNIFHNLFQCFCC